MQYKIGIPIRVRYLELHKEPGITDLKLIVQPPTGPEWHPIDMVDLDNQGIYEASFTPNVTGWWWIRVKSASRPLNVYSKSYFVGIEDTAYLAQENGNIKEINDKLGEVSVSPTSNTLLARLKDLWDKLRELFDNGSARIKIWDGVNQVSITDDNRLRVDIAQTGYTAKSLSEIVDVPIPINTNYWILNITNKTGIVDEIHIIAESDKFMFMINVDGVNYFDERGLDLKAQYLLDTAIGIQVKNIETSTGKDFHWIIPIYFRNSIQIGVRNNLENNKKLRGYIILYREQ